MLPRFATVLLLAAAPWPATADPATSGAPVAPGGVPGPAAIPSATGGAPAIAVRAGTHPGFGRIVFDCGDRTRYAVARDGDRLSLRFAGAPAIGAAPAPPHNVLSIAASDGVVDIVLVPGATIRDQRLGTRVVIDVLDPPARRTELAQSVPSGSPAPPASTALSARTISPTAGPPAAASPSTAWPPTGLKSGQPLPGTDPTHHRAPLRPPASLATPDIGTAALIPVLSVNDQPVPAATQLPRANAVSPIEPAPAATVRADTPPQTSRPPDAPVSASGPAATGATPYVSATGPPADSAQPAGTAAARTDGPNDAPEPMAIAVRRWAGGADGAPWAGPGQGETVLVPFGAEVGIAAFREGNTALLVFDERRPLDVGGLHGDAVFGGASVRLLAAGTLLAVPMPADRRLALDHRPEGWLVTLASPEAPAGEAGIVASVHPEPEAGRLSLPLAAPGRVVALADPAGGATLLVGTQRAPGRGAPLQGVAARHQAPGYVLLPSWAGVAVEPLADEIALHATVNGFALASGSGPIAAAGLGDPGSATTDAALADAAALSRRYDFPPADTMSLQRRLREQIRAAAAASPLGRGEPRRAIAQTMLALGLGAEAQGVLADAMADDPRLAGDPGAAGLAAIAALVAGRTDAARALTDPSLDGTDEITLWRAVRQAQQSEGSPAAAADFAATIRLALSYPPRLASHVVPLALETMAAGGEAEAAAAVLAARKDDASLALARALAAAARGDVDGALAGYDALAAGQDRLLRARALLLAVNLRLATGRIPPTEAAAQLEKMIDAWRGDWRERAVRERLAAVQVQAGAWGAALATLREAEAAFPDEAGAIHAELQGLFTDMLRRKADVALPPLDLVALIDQNADLVPDGPAGAEIARLLADRLSALDLPQRAMPLLDRLMRATRQPTPRAELGATLAELRERNGDAAGALAALAASEPPPAVMPPTVAVGAAAALPAPLPGARGAEPPGPSGTPAPPPLDAGTTGGIPEALRTRRALLASEARMRGGDYAGARAALDGLDAPEALLGRASIGEQAHDWAGAAQALADYARQTLARGGSLTDEQQRTILRWATDASQASDPAAIAAVREAAGPRMQDGPLGGLFRLLVAEPPRGVQDLSRMAQETKLARALPDELKAVDALPGSLLDTRRPAPLPPTAASPP